MYIYKKKEVCVFVLMLIILMEFKQCGLPVNILNILLLVTSVVTYC